MINRRVTTKFFVALGILEPSGFSYRYLAKKLDVASFTLNRVLKGQSATYPEMALRLSKAIGHRFAIIANHYFPLSKALCI